jgi:DNA-binding GntR family transcriptional regulator
MTLTAGLYATLRADIVENRRPPQTRLSEAGLCATFGVSRQPVREVLLRLATDRLVTVHPQRGSFVTPVSVALVHAAQLIRESVEVEVVSRIALTASPALGDALDAAIVDQTAALARDDIPCFYTADEAFHATLAAATGLAPLWPALLDHKVHLDRVRHIALGEGQATASLVDDHCAIRDAVVARDPEMAAKAMRSHLRRVLTILGPLVRRHPGWFSD